MMKLVRGVKRFVGGLQRRVRVLRKFVRSLFYIRTADIPCDWRDVFERYGTTAIAPVLTGRVHPSAGDPTGLQLGECCSGVRGLWMTEQFDRGSAKRTG
jgi:hypothetical protein